jgi:hypothetical protein
MGEVKLTFCDFFFHRPFCMVNFSRGFRFDLSWTSFVESRSFQFVCGRGHPGRVKVEVEQQVVIEISGRERVSLTFDQTKSYFVTASS